MSTNSREFNSPDDAPSGKKESASPPRGKLSKIIGIVLIALSAVVFILHVNHSPLVGLNSLATFTSFFLMVFGPATGFVLVLSRWIGHGSISRPNDDNAFLRGLVVVIPAIIIAIASFNLFLANIRFA